MNLTTLSALAEPTRLQMVELLFDGPLTVNEIADRLHIRQPQASKHLRILSDAELVEARPEANRRIYALQPDPLREMDEWLGKFREMWEDRFDRLEDYLQELQQNDKGI